MDLNFGVTYRNCTSAVAPQSEALLRDSWYSDYLLNRLIKYPFLIKTKLSNSLRMRSLVHFWIPRARGLAILQDICIVSLMTE